MASVCFYFQVHQPYRIRSYSIQDIGNDSSYFNYSGQSNLDNNWVLNKVAQKCYLPANRLFLELIRTNPEFKISYSFSGVYLEQIKVWQPEVLKSFQELVATGRVEILAETYYHSLASLYSEAEFIAQVEEHAKLVRELFGVRPQVFRNTELIYSDQIAEVVKEMGYRAILTEGADHILGWRSPNFVYQSPNQLALLLKNYKLSDDIAFRFSSQDWSDFPLTAPKFASWLSAINGSGQLINLFMDYETFGEHQWESTGIFDFLKALPGEILANPDNDFVTPSEAVQRYQPVAELNITEPISWADVERDLSAWQSNEIQKEALVEIYGLEAAVKKANNQTLLADWRKLQTSDHFYYMCTKWFADGDVHKYFNPYDSPYEAFIAYMNCLADLKLRLKTSQTKQSALSSAVIQS